MVHAAVMSDGLWTVVIDIHIWDGPFWYWDSGLTSRSIFLFQTFVIISKKLKRYHIFRFSATRALFCLAPWNKLRKFCLTVISNQWFDWFILLTIIVNCLFMMVQPSNPKCVLYAHTNGTTARTESELMSNNTNSSSISCDKTVDYIKDVPEWVQWSKLFCGLVAV